jgi:GNAT superfamily N-acetyltransferase
MIKPTPLSWQQGWTVKVPANDRAWFVPFRDRKGLQIAVRPATANDFPVFSFLYFASLIRHEPDLADEARRVRLRRLRRYFLCGQSLVILRDGCPSGWAQIGHGPRSVMLLQLHLTQEARSQGIGSALMAQLNAFADRNGRWTIVSILKRNRRAIDFYSRFGFQNVRTTARVVRMRRPPVSGSSRSRSAPMVSRAHRKRCPISSR